MTYYTAEIKMPTTKREGLENFIQMIINHLEADNTREALLTAVDLRQDVTSGIYDQAITESEGEPVDLNDPDVVERKIISRCINLILESDDQITISVNDGEEISLKNSRDIEAILNE